MIHCFRRIAHGKLKVHCYSYHCWSLVSRFPSNIREARDFLLFHCSNEVLAFHAIFVIVAFLVIAFLVLAVIAFLVLAVIAFLVLAVIAFLSRSNRSFS